MVMLKNFIRFIRIITGFATIQEICDASKGEKDYHDYYYNRGGDATPSHFHEYTCWNCGKKFTI